MTAGFGLTQRCVVIRIRWKAKTSANGTVEAPSGMPSAWNENVVNGKATYGLATHLA